PAHQPGTAIGEIEPVRVLIVGDVYALARSPDAPVVLVQAILSACRIDEYVMVDRVEPVPHGPHRPCLQRPPHSEADIPPELPRSAGVLPPHLRVVAQG